MDEPSDDSDWDSLDLFPGKYILVQFSPYESLIHYLSYLGNIYLQLTINEAHFGMKSLLFLGCNSQVGINRIYSNELCRSCEAPIGPKL